jgi:hypothetical protein
MKGTMMFCEDDFAPGQHVKIRKSVAASSGVKPEAIVSVIHKSDADSFYRGGLSLTVQTSRGSCKLFFRFDEIDPDIPVIPMIR